MHISAALGGKIEWHKQAAIDIKPFGAKLDGCRGTLERAHACGDAALRALEAAQVQVAKTDSQITTLTEKLATLESQVAAQGVEQEAVQANSIEKLAVSLQTVLAEMLKGETVPSDLLANTEAQMSNLLTGIRSISAAAQVQATNAAPASGSAPPPKRDAPANTLGGLPPLARRKIVGKHAYTEYCQPSLIDEDEVFPVVPLSPGES